MIPFKPGGREQSLQTGGRETPVIMRDEVPAGREWDGQENATSRLQAAKRLGQESRRFGHVLEGLRAQDHINRGIGDRPAIALVVSRIGHAVAEVSLGVDVVDGLVDGTRMNQESIGLGPAADIENQPPALGEQSAEVAPDRTRLQIDEAARGRRQPVRPGRDWLESGRSPGFRPTLPVDCGGAALQS